MRVGVDAGLPGRGDRGEGTVTPQIIGVLVLVGLLVLVAGLVEFRSEGDDPTLFTYLVAGFVVLVVLILLGHAGA